MADDHALDSSAVIAVVLRESGWEVVRDTPMRIISSVNLAESVSSLTNKGYSFSEARYSVGALRMRVIDFDREQAIEAARLRPLTRAYGLSLGDRACLALAHLRSLPVLTSDQKWAAAAPHVAVRLIR